MAFNPINASGAYSPGFSNTVNPYFANQAYPQMPYPQTGMGHVIPGRP